MSTLTKSIVTNKKMNISADLKKMGTWKQHRKDQALIQNYEHVILHSSVILHQKKHAFK